MVAGREVQTCAWPVQTLQLRALKLLGFPGQRSTPSRLPEFSREAELNLWRSKFLTFGTPSWHVKLTTSLRWLPAIIWCLKLNDWYTNSFPSGRWCFRSGSSTCFRSSLVAPTGPEAKLFLNRMYWGWWHSAQIGSGHGFGTHPIILTASLWMQHQLLGTRK